MSHYRTCAVVSNSGVLRSQSHGHEIDAADAVFRFNLAPAGGEYLGIVGQRETVRIINDRAAQETLTNSLPGLDFRMVKEAVVVPFAEPDPQTLFDIQTFHEWHDNIHMLMIEQDMLAVGERLLTKLYAAEMFNDNAVCLMPTSGFVGMLLALSVCDQVHAYGLAATPSSAHAPYHYYRSIEEYGNQPAHVNHWHGTFPAEKDLWRRLATNRSSLDQSERAEILGFAAVSC
eukprot:6475704-Amphidinium_carterae.1